MPDVYPADAAPDASAEEQGRLLFAKPCHFVAGAADETAIPTDALPEIAFAGRSNVGKSSLVNALTGQNALARVSRSPGRTQQINFFELGSRLMLVDLPGYGYAAAPKQTIAHWTRLIERYLRGRASLLRVLVLLDARFGVKETDEPVLRLLDEAAISFQAVLTKADLLEDSALAALLPRLAAMLARHAAAHPVIHITSAARGLGIAALRGALATLAAERGAR
ncbi:MAG: ribosome biogenesis GTP-binding protein YihA/YsxC [Stellaceae bacterium]